jgi:hypothetical protein
MAISVADYRVDYSVVPILAIFRRHVPRCWYAVITSMLSVSTIACVGMCKYVSMATVYGGVDARRYQVVLGGPG